MSHRNTTCRRSLWLTLFLALSLSPISAQALDLYMLDIEVTGGANYVIDGIDPPDKLFPGNLIALGPLGELPKSTTLTTTLRRSPTLTTVSEATRTYTSTEWILAASGLFLKFQQ